MNDSTGDDWLLQSDVIQELESNRKSLWITVDKSRSDSQGVSIYSSITKIDNISNTLRSDSWNLWRDSCFPYNNVISDGKGSEKVEYVNYCHEAFDHIPLVVYQYHHGMFKETVSILQEFIMFYDLYYMNKENKYIRILSDGSFDDVVLFVEDEIKIRSKYIKEFLSIKDMVLVLYVDSLRYTDSTNLLTDDDRLIKNDRGSDHRFVLSVVKRPDFVKGEIVSRLLGKLVVRGMEKSKVDMWPYNENKKDSFEEFVIGEDEQGVVKVFTCDPNKLADYFGNNADAPHYLTPVFFKKQVLDKYYRDTLRYEVSNGLIRCKGLWSIRIDNDMPDLVAVFLGDLGRDLPSISEQLYWKSFNVVYGGGISESYLRTSIFGQWVRAELPENRFIHYLEEVNEHWLRNYGYIIFKNLNESDRYFYNYIRRPIGDNHVEFDESINALTKILIESLNVRDIKKDLGDEVDDGERSINLLVKVIHRNDEVLAKEVEEILKLLYEAKSILVSHRKGNKSNREIMKALRVEEYGYTRAYELLLEKINGIMALIVDKC